MDFRFRPEDRRNAPPPPPYFFPPPNSHPNNNFYFTEQAMRAGYFNNGGIVRTDYFFSNSSDPVSEAAFHHQREIEKERIREEIIAAEIIRKRALEAEVRREMAMELQLGFPLLSNNNNPNLSNQIPLHFQHNLSINNNSPNLSNQIISLRPEVGSSIEKLPFQRHPDAVKITELKPAGVSSITGIKRKITAIGVNGFALTSSKKKVQKEWSCALCKVSATSEKGLEAHLQGRKHKAKEQGLMRAKGAISLEIEGSGGVSKNGDDEPDLANVSSSSEEEVPAANMMNDDKEEPVQKDEADENEQEQNDQGEKHEEDDEAELNFKEVENKETESATITLLDKPEGSIGGEMPVKAMKSENNGEAKTLQENQNHEDVKKKFKFWCEHCRIGCRNAINMADHERGKKHMALMQRFRQDSEDVKLVELKKAKAVVQIKEKTEDFKKKFKYWCELCQVGCKSEKTVVVHEKGKKHMARLRIAEQDVGVQSSEANIGKVKAVELVNEEATENAFGNEDTPATTIAAVTDATSKLSNEEGVEYIDGKIEALTTTTTIADITAAASETPGEEVMENVGGEVNEQDALADATSMTPDADATGETSNGEVKERVRGKVKEQETLADIATSPFTTDAIYAMSNEELMEIFRGEVDNPEALTTSTTTTITDAISECVEVQMDPVSELVNC